MVFQETAIKSYAPEVGCLSLGILWEKPVAGGVERPFGRVKSCGHVREKGFEGLVSFTQLKTIAIKHD